MNEFFSEILSSSGLLYMSAMASVLILLVAALRPWLGKRLPRLFFLLIWLLVLARLLVPFELPFAGSVYNLMSGDAVLPQVTVPQQLIPAQPFIGVQPIIGADVSDTPGVSYALLPWTGSMKQAAAKAVWLVGALVMAAFLFGSHLTGRRVYDTALPLQNAVVDEWLAGHPLRRRVRVVVSDRISTPLTYGVLRPVLLLPKTLDMQDEETLGYVLAHEWVHIRRFDALWKLLLAAALCVHWFNPCVWLFCWLADRDLELACDEQVLSSLGGAHKKRYAEVLLTLEEHRPLPLCSSFSHSLTAGRIRAIVDYRKPGFWVVTAAVVLALAVGALLLTSPEGISEQEQRLGDQWAQTLVDRDGAARAALMTEEYREQWQAGREYDSIGVSSPWPVGWQLGVHGRTMLVTYETRDSGGGEYIYQEELRLADTAEGLRVADSRVTVEYLDCALYQQVLDMAADNSGLYDWRADPLAVASNFLLEDASFAGNLTLLEDDGNAPRRTVWQDANGAVSTVVLYQPVLTAEDIWAVYSYSVGDHHRILHNVSLALNTAELQNTGLVKLTTADKTIKDEVASIFVSPDELVKQLSGDKTPKDGDIVAFVSPDEQSAPTVIWRGAAASADSKVKLVRVGEADHISDLVSVTYTDPVLLPDAEEISNFVVMDKTTGEIARLYTKPVLVADAETGEAALADGVLPCGLLWPVPVYNISRGYDARHGGVDIPGEQGCPVWSAADGVVIYAGFDGKNGNMVVIEHQDGLQTEYAHLAGIGVDVGDVVVGRQVIGTLGSTGQSTGAHLHFALWVDGLAVDPLAYSGK